MVLACSQANQRKDSSTDVHIRHAINSALIHAGDKPACTSRELHSRLAPWVLLPLLVTMSSGVTYRLARDWFGCTREQVHWLMVIHEGEWLGETLEPVVVLLNATVLLWMLVTGGAILLNRWRRKVS